MRYNLMLFALILTAWGVTSLRWPRIISNFNTFFWKPGHSPTANELLLIRFTSFFDFVFATIVFVFGFVGLT
jgi:hypothetical protein